MDQRCRERETAPASLFLSCLLLLFFRFPLQLGVPRGARACLSPVNGYCTTDRLTLANPHRVSDLFFFRHASASLWLCADAQLRHSFFFLFFFDHLHAAIISQRCQSNKLVSFNNESIRSQLSLFKSCFVPLCIYIYVYFLSLIANYQNYRSCSALFAFCYLRRSYSFPQSAPLQCKLRQRNYSRIYICHTCVCTFNMKNLRVERVKRVELGRAYLQKSLLCRSI